MKLQNCFTLLLASYSLAQPTSKSIRSGDCLWTGTGKLSQEEIVQHWYTLWAGDYSYLNKTVTPNVQLYQDRFPTGNGSASLPVFDSSAMLSFVKTARTGFETYSFIDDFHYGVENLITLRWTLNATSAGGEDRCVWLHISEELDIDKVLAHSPRALLWRTMGLTY